VVFSGAGVLAALVSGAGDGVCSVALAAGITTAESSDPAAAVPAMSLCDSFAVLRIVPASFFVFVCGLVGVSRQLGFGGAVGAHPVFNIHHQSFCRNMCNRKYLYRTDIIKQNGGGIWYPYGN
jgi:hypothetical protein